MRDRLIRVVKRTSKKIITLSAATVMAFSGLAVAAPFFLSQTAYAAPGTHAVSPLDTQGWAFFDDDPGVGTESGSLVNGPSGTPLGTGSAQLSVDSNGRAALGTSGFAGTALNSISALSYSSYQSGPTLAITLQFDVRYHPTDTGYQGRLVFEPYQTSGTVASGWTSWDTLSGKWWATKTTAAGSNGLCSQSAPCTWAQMKANWPDASILTSGNLLFKAGGPWTGGFSGNVDDLRIATDMQDITYDFEYPAPTEVYVDSAYTQGSADGHIFGYNAFSTIQDGVAAVATDGVVTLNGDISVGSEVVISKSITLDGNSHTITPTFTNSSSLNNSVIGIIGVNGVTISNLTVDGVSGTSLHGINTFKAGADLESITLKNNDKYGLVVNGSTIAVNNITTSGNGWGGIDVDQSSTSNIAVLTVNGTSAHSEAGADILIDNTTKPVTVTDTNNQYSHKDTGNTRVYTLLEADQTTPTDSGEATVNNITPQVVVTDASQPLNITVASGTTNASLDYSSLVSSNVGTIPQTTINSPTATVSIPAATTVTASGGIWDGVINAPAVQSNTSVTVPTPSGSTTTIGTVIEVGAGNISLTFDKAVRLLIPGQVGGLVGFVRTGDFTQISSVCSADDQATEDTSLPAGGECYISVGSDMVVWTKHFTKFVTYSQTANPPASNSTGSASSSSTNKTKSASQSQGVAAVQGESTNAGQTSSTNTSIPPAATVSQPKIAAKEAVGGGLRWYWIVLLAIAVVGLGLATVYRYAEGTDRK